MLELGASWLCSSDNWCLLVFASRLAGMELISREFIAGSEDDWFMGGGLWEGFVFDLIRFD